MHFCLIFALFFAVCHRVFNTNLIIDLPNLQQYQQNMVENKNSSVNTVLAIFSSMMGGSLLIFPILYRSAGIITSSIVLMLSGCISFSTCRIYVFHMSPQDVDVESTIKRILGSKWQRFFRMITGFYLILLCIIFLEIIMDQLYSILFFLLDFYSSSTEIAAKDAFAFNTFSIQYLSLILFLPFLGLVSLKNLQFMIKLSEYGAYSALLYFLFVAYQFVLGAIEGTFNFSNIVWFSADIGNLAGTCAFAFTIHTTVVTFVKNNRNQKNNVRDVGLAYVMGFCIYELIGVLGAFAVSGKDCKETLINCYLKEWLVLVVELTYLFGRVVVFPCTLEISRTRLLQLFYAKVTTRHRRIFNFSFVIAATLFSILSPFLPITLMMNIVGAVICYCFIYLIPAAMHYKCLYFAKRDDQSLIDSSISLGDRLLGACQHPASHSDRRPFWLRAMFYGLLNLIGVAIGVYGLYTCFHQIFA